MAIEFPKHPITSELPNPDQRIPRPPTRRKFLKTIGGCLVGIPATDQLLTNLEWPPDEPQLRLLPYSQTLLRTGRQPEGWLTADGLGHQNGQPEAGQFANAALHNKEPMGYFVYANGGITTESLAPLVATYAKQLGHLSLSGVSLGGLISLEAARKAVVENGQNIHLRRIVLNCSPFDIDDAWQAGSASLIARLDPHGGFFGEVAYNMYGALGSGPYDPKTLKADAVNSIEETIHGIPAGFWTGELVLLNNTDLNANWRDFKTHSIITPDTKVLFCAPQNLLSDGLVNDASSYTKYSEFFSRFGVAVNYLALPGAGHADTVLASQYAEPWIRATA